MADEIIREEPALVRLRMTDRLWSIFEAHRLSFGSRGQTQIPAVDLMKSARIEQYTDYTNGHVLSTIGAFSYQRAHPLVMQMGRYCSIADQTWVMGERHPVEHVTTSSFLYRTPRPSFRWAREDLLDGSTQFVPPTRRTGPVPVLEHDVWTGNNVMLARGITLHTGCVVGAGAVVTRDVPPYAIVGGSPARVIRLRFAENLVERLLASRWWECHPRVLFEYDMRDPSRFLDALEEGRATLPPFAPKILTWQTLKPMLQG
jgi:acetyltransferase-like isoleucine patch superfamily enzyme